MRNAALHAETSGPDTEADLAATLAQVRAALRRPGNCAATTRALTACTAVLADITAILVEHKSAACAVAAELDLLAGQIDIRPSLPPVPASRAVRILRVV
jgi:hypothetical protein